MTSLVLIGWTLNIQSIKSIEPNWVSMKPNTAITLWLSAFCIFNLEKKHMSRWSILFRIITAITAGIGFLTLTEYLLGTDFRIDMPDETERMGPNTAFNLCLFGIAFHLTVFQKPKANRWIEILTYSCILISFFAFVGYLCEVELLYRATSSTRMALHTSISFICLCLALISSQPDLAIVRTMTSQSAGGIMVRRWLPLAVIVPLTITRVCLLFIQAGYLNIHTWFAIYVTPIIVFIGVAITKYARLANELDEDNLKIELELKKRQLEARYTLSNAIDHFLASSPEIENAYSQVLEVICNHLSWKCAIFWLVNRDPARLIYEASWSGESPKIKAFIDQARTFTYLPFTDLNGRIWDTNQPHWVPDIAQEKTFPRSSYALEAGLHGIVGFPIRIGNQVYGVIEVFSEQIEKPDLRLLSDCEAIGIHIGAFIQKKQMEKIIKAERDFAKTLFESSSEGIFSFDRELRITAWNKAMEKITGITSEKLLGQKVIESFPHVTKESIHERYNAVLSGERVHIHEQEFISPLTQEKGYYESHWVPLIDSKNEIIGGLVVVSDITKRKRTEAELREQEGIMFHAAKMASLGEMAGGIAHEINTPLSTIALNASRIQDRLNKEPLDKDSIQKSIDHIEKTTFRLAKIVKGLRYFAKEEPSEEFQPQSLKVIIDDTLALCSERFRSHGIELIVQNIPDSLIIDCRGIQICQTLLNLLNNAHDAIEMSDEKWIKVSVETTDGSVEISVTDSGPRIPPHIQERLMQPFFTTKEVGKGTGLGLSISKGIIESHRGTLSYDSLSKNTRFVVNLPRKQPNPETHNKELAA